VTKWTFFGEIYPERIPVTLGTPLSGHANLEGLNAEFDYRVILHAGQAIVDLTVTKGNLDVDSMRNAARDCIMTITDLIGFQQGGAFEVEIISGIQRDTGEWRVFGIEIPVLASLKQDKDKKELAASLIIAVSENVPAQIALANFREAIRSAVGTGFHCFRAIEAIMQSMKTPSDQSDSSAWKLLRNNLCFDRSVIDAVKKHADFPRHGRPSSITDTERGNVFLFTHEIISRFLKYLVRGKTPLLSAEFPILKL